MLAFKTNLTEAAELSLCDGRKCIPGSVTIDQLLDVRWLDFAAVVEDVTGGGDEYLGQVKRRMLDLAEAHRNVAVGAC